MLDEQKIIHWLKSGDPKGMNMLYDNYSAALFGIALKVVGDQHLAEDVLQESFVKIWNNASKYETSKGTLFTWCLNILRNTAIDKTRSSGFKRSGKTKTMDHYVDIGKTDIHPDQIGVKDFVSKLDPKYRSVIDLIYFQGFTQREVEEELNIPLGTVKSRLRIGLRTLREIFDSPYFAISYILLVLELSGNG